MLVACVSVAIYLSVLVVVDLFARVIFVLTVFGPIQGLNLAYSGVRYYCCSSNRDERRQLYSSAALVWPSRSYTKHSTSTVTSYSERHNTGLAHVGAAAIFICVCAGL